MKINIYEVGVDFGRLNKTEDIIDIKRGRWVDRNNTSHPMNFTKKECFENKYTYWLSHFGEYSKIYGSHISLNFWENQKFLFMQKSHWLQKEENVRYTVNVLFLIGGLTIGLLNLLK